MADYDWNFSSYDVHLQFTRILSHFRATFVNRPDFQFLIIFLIPMVRPVIIVNFSGIFSLIIKLCFSLHLLPFHIRKCPCKF